jgi:hypothetical protein
MQAEQLLDAIPRLFEGSQASEAAAGAAITAAVAALKVCLCIGWVPLQAPACKHGVISV